jgi:hypothetical protein
LSPFLSLHHRPDKSAQPLPGVFNCFAALDGSKSRLLTGAVFHGVDVQRENFLLAFALHLLVETLPGLLAEPASLDHFFDQRRHFVAFARFVIRCGFVDVPHHVTEHVQANDVGSAERRRLRPAHGGPGAGVDFLHGHIELFHQPQRVQHREGADAVGNEVWRVFRNHHALAEPAVAKVAQRFDHLRRRFRSGNDFHQLQVARRVKEVCAGPVLLKLVGQSFGNQAYGQARGVGGNDGSGFAELRDTGKELALDL